MSVATKGPAPCSVREEPDEAGAVCARVSAVWVFVNLCA